MNQCNQILVSAIIITYKRPIQILKRAVMSVLNQTHKNLEIIIVNDYPEDLITVNEIKEMLDEFKDERLIYIVHKKNYGACKARNTGILASKGEFIALLDDDDEWLPEKIEHQLNGFCDKDTGMIYSPFYNVSSDKMQEEFTIRETKSGDLLIDLLWKNCIGGSSMTLIRKDVFNKCGLFDEQLLSSQDYDMWIRIAMNYKIVCINEPLTRRFMQSESITTNFNKQKQGFNLLTEKYIELYKKYPKAYNYRLNRRVNKWIEQGHIREALNLYCKAIKVKKLSKYNITEPIKGFIKFIKNKIKNTN